MREAIRLSKAIQPPEQKSDFHDVEHSPEIPVTNGEENEEDNGDHSPKIRLSDISTERPSLETDFRHLLQLVRAYLTAERGNLAQGFQGFGLQFPSPAYVL